MTGVSRPAGRLGVIGIGVMGSAIAARLIECGYAVVVHDRNDGKAEPLLRAGAELGTSPADVAARTDIVITSLNSAASIEDVVFGANGVVAAPNRNLLIVDMSSIDPLATRTMSARLKAEAGIGWVDAPLSGGAPAALTGALTLMVGGEAADLERARAPLSALARNITHMGGSGAGQTTKLINQVLCACGFMAVAEATRLAKDASLDVALIPGALAGGRADSPILQEFMIKMARGDLTPTGRIDNMLKDLQGVEVLASRLGTPMPVTSLVTTLHRMMIAGGLGASDSAAYISLFDLGRSLGNATDE